MWRKENVGRKRWRKGKEDYDDQEKQEEPHGGESLFENFRCCSHTLLIQTIKI